MTFAGVKNISWVGLGLVVATILCAFAGTDFLIIHSYLVSLVLATFQVFRANPPAVFRVVAAWVIFFVLDRRGLSQVNDPLII